MHHLYVVVRRDLPIEHQAVQASHAALASGRRFSFDEHPSLVLVTVPDEPSLRELRDRLTIESELFHEEDMGGEATAFATEPITGDDRKQFSGLPLLRGSNALPALLPT